MWGRLVLDACYFEHAGCLCRVDIVFGKSCHLHNGTLLQALLDEYILLHSHRDVIVSDVVLDIHLHQCVAVLIA